MKLDSPAPRISSGWFVWVMIADMSQRDIYKAHPDKFFSKLAAYSGGTATILCLTLTCIWFLLFINNLSSNDAEKLRKSQQSTAVNADLLKLWFGLIIGTSSLQYVMHRSGTELTLWHFSLSATITVSLGLLAGRVASHLVNRRLQAENQLYKTVPYHHD